ncbi:hypothetical protein DCO48_05350 [Pseudomonas sp. SDI]|uniref:EF-hand domain-containing protein n=1 Tax=Pseudomonas sp. SDI TaxID=2170734 RepID=UPI000DE75629|nr:EF-hand domain-containing protein [Pseudomonas sp. SDI]PWB34571.1 hypothetical protein DCO48_05350 [Pseudomonas sp. SDI]
MANQEVTLDDVKAILKKMDANNDGKTSLSEFTDYMTKQDFTEAAVEMVVRFINVNKDDNISAEEYLNALRLNIF